MSSKLQTWRRLPLRTQLAVLESAVMLTASWIAVRYFFPRIGAWATRPSPPGSQAPPAQLQDEVRCGISIAARNLPWNCVCLPRAIAGKLLLARRGFESTIRLGVGLKEGALSAHAWLEVGPTILIGRRGSEDLSVLV